jgi:hypothetical protein
MSSKIQIPMNINRFFTEIPVAYEWQLGLA